MEAFGHMLWGECGVLKNLLRAHPYILEFLEYALKHKDYPELIRSWHAFLLHILMVVAAELEAEAQKTQRIIEYFKAEFPDKAAGIPDLTEGFKALDEAIRHVQASLWNLN